MWEHKVSILKHKKSAQQRHIFWRIFRTKNSKNKMKSFTYNVYKKPVIYVTNNFLQHWKCIKKSGQPCRNNEITSYVPTWQASCRYHMLYTLKKTETMELNEKQRMHEVSPILCNVAHTLMINYLCIELWCWNA